jgi:hypothetical protein
VAFCKTRVGRELDTIGGKSKFVLHKVTDRAFYYQVSQNDIRKQNIRYVERVLEQYAKIQSLNPGHYSNITPNASFILALIQIYEGFQGQQTKK